MDMTLYALLNKKIKGAVSGISNYTIIGTDLIFTFTNGTTATMHFPEPAPGVSIINVEVDESNHLICSLSDHTIIDAGLIPTIKGDKGYSPQIVENKDNDANVYRLDIISETDTFTTPNLKGNGIIEPTMIFATLATFPATGQAKKLYIDIETNKCYIYNNNQYQLVGDGDNQVEWESLS